GVRSGSRWGLARRRDTGRMSARAVRKAATVHGLVQGVSFRWYTVQEADRLGVAGWVRNERDGTVRLEVEGDEDAVAALVEWLHDGPPAAQVTRVEVDDLEPTGADAAFRVEH